MNDALFLDSDIEVEMKEIIDGKEEFHALEEGRLQLLSLISRVEVEGVCQAALESAESVLGERVLSDNDDMAFYTIEPSETGKDIALESLWASVKSMGKKAWDLLIKLVKKINDFFMTLMRKGVNGFKAISAYVRGRKGDQVRDFETVATSTTPLYKYKPAQLLHEAYQRAADMGVTMKYDSSDVFDNLNKQFTAKADKKIITGEMKVSFEQLTTNLLRILNDVYQEDQLDNISEYFDLLQANMSTVFSGGEVSDSLNEELLQSLRRVSALFIAAANEGAYSVYLEDKFGIIDPRRDNEDAIKRSISHHREKVWPAEAIIPGPYAKPSNIPGFDIKVIQQEVNIPHDGLDMKDYDLADDIFTIDRGTDAVAVQIAKLVPDVERGLSSLTKKLETMSKSYDDASKNLKGSEANTDTKREIAVSFYNATVLNNLIGGLSKTVSLLSVQLSYIDRYWLIVREVEKARLRIDELLPPTEEMVRILVDDVKVR